MAARPPNRVKTNAKGAFVAQDFLESTGVARKVVEFRRKETIFSQGDPSKNVIYIQKGGVRLSVVNETGKEAVVGILGPGDFLGEGCLAGQSIRMGTATAIAPTTALVIEKQRRFASSTRNMSFPTVSSTSCLPGISELKRT